MRMYAYAVPEYVNGEIRSNMTVISDLGILIDEWEPYYKLAKSEHRDVNVLDCVEHWVLDNFAWEITDQLEDTMT